MLLTPQTKLINNNNNNKAVSPQSADRVTTYQPTDIIYVRAIDCCCVLQKRILSAFKSKLGPHFNQQMMKDNLLKLDIYYKEFNFEHIKEIPAYSVKYAACNVSQVGLAAFVK